MSKIEVDKIDPQSGTALEVGTSGDTVTVPSGVTLTTTNATLNLPTTITSTTEVKTNKISPATGTAFALGDSGDTFTVPAGATIVNSGTATGFGGGAMTLLSATTLGSDAATIDIDNVFSTTYNCYKVFILNLTNEGTEFPGIRYLVSGTAQTGDYMILGDGCYRTSTTAGTGTEWDAGYLEDYMSLGNWNYDDNGIASNHEMTFFEPNGGAYPNQVLGSSMMKQAAYPVTWNWSSWYASDINATGFRILMSSGGNIISGCKVNVYGFNLS